MKASLKVEHHSLLPTKTTVSEVSQLHLLCDIYVLVLL